MMEKEPSFSYKVRLPRRMVEMKKRQLANKKINRSGSDFADYLYNIIDTETHTFINAYRKTRGGLH